jgi:hypothetical protein
MAYTQQTPIGTPDVNLITKTLAGLQPDSALQQYAMLHKNNPYILSLAKSESDRRRSLRMAAQGNLGQMPTVADQSIAGMAQQQLPENQGIARIPAPNMQGMADGGIAGYGDGDDVPRKNGMAMGGMYDFAQRSEPVVRMADGGHIPRYQGNTTDGSVVKSSIQQIEDSSIAALSPLAQQFKTAEQQFIAAARSGDQAAISQYMQVKEDLRRQLEQAVSTKFGNAAPKVLSQLLSSDKPVAAAESKYPASTATRAKDFPGVKPGFEKMPVDMGAPTDKAPAAAPAPQSNLPTGGTSVKQAQDLGSKFYDLKGIEGKLEQAQMQERQDIANEKEARAAKLEAFNKAQGPAMAGYEKLLKGEEMQDATDKEKAGLMSLMKGFLAMAAGESPNAATNIAKGAMVGMGDYGDALKEFKKSAKERNKAMAEIENARRAEAKGDLKDAQIYEDKANDYMRASKQSGIKAIIDATGKSSEISAGLYKSATDNAAANARTMMQVNAPSGIERIVDRMARDPKFAESYKNYASIGPEAKGFEAELQAYLKNPMMIKATNPDLAAQFDAIIKQRMLTPTNKPTGQVLVGQ